MVTLALCVSLALGASFLCSLLEAVLLSLTPSYIAELEAKSRTVARSLRQLKINIHRPLAAILSLNTIAHTAGAAGAGAQVQKLWGSSLLAVASAVLTLLILVLSEILPKTLGARYWRRLGPLAAGALPVLIVLFYPFVLLSERFNRALAPSHSNATVSREEIAALAHLGAQEGVLGGAETRVLRNLFRVGALRARDIMTPRTVLFSFRSDTLLAEAIERVSEMPFSRILLYRDHEEDVVGYVLKQDLFLHASRHELRRSVDELRRELLVVPESIAVATLLERFIEKSEQIALVVDEYGGVAGVATIEDVVETLLGFEIVDEADSVRDLRALARARWFERTRRLGISDAPPAESVGTQSTDEP